MSHDHRPPVSRLPDETLQRSVEALQRSIKELADLKYALDQSAIVAATDIKGIITYANDKFCEISKYSREELIGQDHRIVNSGYHPKEFIRDLWRTIARGEIWRGEIRNRAKDGTIYWVDTTIVPFLEPRGKPYQYLAIRYDITERKRSEALLREQESLARLGEMAAVVAHEVRNPIAGIRGALQVIGGRMAEESRDRSIIHDILARLDDLNATVEDLLLFARPRQPRRAAVPFRALAQGTVELLQRDPKFAKVHVGLEGDDPILQVDAELLRSALQNLILNAGEAAGPGGHVQIRVTAQDGRCMLVIADSGPGIPPHIKERLFEPFFSTKHRGTGLGLAIAKRIIEMHHGAIDVASPSEGGAVVTVTLPGP